MTSSSDLCRLIFRHGWLLPVLATNASAVMWGLRATRQFEADPTLARRNRRLLPRCLVLGNVPWVVMAFGMEIGGVPSILHFMNPRHGYFVIAFWGVTVVTWLGVAYRIFRGIGPETLVYDFGPVGSAELSPLTVRMLVALVVLAGTVAMVFLSVVQLRI